MDGETLKMIISLASLFLAGIFGYFALRSRNQGEDKAEGIEAGRINTTLTNISDTVKEIKVEMKENNREMRALADRVTIVERDQQTAFKRIDELRDDFDKKGA